MWFYIDKEEQSTILDYSKNIKGKVNKKVHKSYTYRIAIFKWKHFWEPLYVNFVKQYSDDKSPVPNKFKVKITSHRYQATVFSDYEEVKKCLNDIRKNPDNYIL